MARKNGKTELVAALALYGLIADNEMGAEIYFVATKKDQAKVGFNAAKTMLGYLKQDSAIVRAEFSNNSHTIYSEKWNSFCRAMGRDSKSEDGPSPHLVIVDEYHAHVDDQMVNVMESGMGGREQPMTLIITTAGYNVQGPCKLFDDNIAKPILDGDLDDPTTFAIIYEAEKPASETHLNPGGSSDDYQDPTPGKHWWANDTHLAFANPGLDNGTPSKDHLKDRMDKAEREGGEKQVDFLTKNLNVFTRAKKVWIQESKFKKCQHPTMSIDKMKGLKCYLGLDLAQVRDITSLSVFFPVQKGVKLPHFFQYYWVPRENAEQRQKDDKVPYLTWMGNGFIRATEGDTVDHDTIERDILEITKNLKPRGLAYDPWRAETVQQHLKAAGLKTYEFRQTTAIYNEPVGIFETMILGGDCKFEPNPVTSWMLSNVHIRRDRNGNRAIDKDKSQDKVDGIVAAVMALGLHNKISGKGKHKRKGLILINHESEKK